MDNEYSSDGEQDPGKKKNETRHRKLYYVIYQLNIQKHEQWFIRSC